MDVLVEWYDKTRNVVRSSELRLVGPAGNRKFETGSRVCMVYEKKRYYGKILAIEKEENESDGANASDCEQFSESGEDDEPLSKLCKYSESNNLIFDNLPDRKRIFSDTEDDEPLSELKKKSENNNGNAIIENMLDRGQLIESNDDEPFFDVHALLNVTFTVGKESETENSVFGDCVNSMHFEENMENACVVCGEELYGACGKCAELLCYTHFWEDGELCEAKHFKRLIQTPSPNTTCAASSRVVPEYLAMEGFEREEERVKPKRNHPPIRENAKKLRNLGKAYVSPSTGKQVAAKVLGPKKCSGKACEKLGRSCKVFSDENRQKIFDDFYETGDLENQREYILRHVTEFDKKTDQRVSNETPSRRSKSLQYRLPYGSGSVLVCKTFFLNTLATSEKVVRTSLKKVSDVSHVRLEDNRGGRHEKQKKEDEQKRLSVVNHINSFPRVESHYCRASSSKEYLHPDLSLLKMYALYLEVHPESEVRASYSLYRRVFGEMNLSFHSPKKDQCSLCVTYISGDVVTKATLETEYQKHLAEKNKVRALKKDCKELAIKNPNSYASAVFDLQQVMFLPISKESAVFYKRKFSVFNFTVYNLGNKECACFTWNECDSGRGSSEISTCVFSFLREQDKLGKLSVSLFCDGCGGQNKNSIIAAMLLYFIRGSDHITEVSVRYFETNHGQNEGDTAHSAIAYAIKNAGDLFVPSQLLPIFALARRKNPYSVHKLEFNDILDFKQLSKDLKILSCRENEINWTELKEIKVEKHNPKTIYFKKSHLAETYSTLNLEPPTRSFALPKVINQLHNSLQPIAKAKYLDLMSLCDGNYPVIRSHEHTSFYKNLPYVDKANVKKLAGKKQAAKKPVVKKQAMKKQVVKKQAVKK